MRPHGKSIAACMAIAALLAAAGCGGSQETDPPEASINDPQVQTTPAEANAAPPPQPAPDPKHPVVIIETSLGSITVELDKEKAPLTVDNFLSYVDRGHYDGTIFHQVYKDFPKLVIGGAYTADLTDKPVGAPIRNEAHNGLKNARGAIAMARRDDAIDSATCHFFLNLSDNDVLDHTDRTLSGYGYCVFGKITDAIQVADQIADVAVHDTDKFERIPVQQVVIKSVRRVK